MSSNNSQPAKYANSNLNPVLSGKSSTAASHGGTGSARVGYHGMLVLSKRPRAGSKLSIPPPVNLPSIRKEHSGNDPNTQLVSGSGSWSKPEESAPGSSKSASVDSSTRPPPSSASLNVASESRSIGGFTGASSAWQPLSGAPTPPSYGFRAPPGASDRQLNPEEYPSLDATTKASVPYARRPNIRAHHEFAQEHRGWADDERAPSLSWRAPDWSERAMDSGRYDRMSDRALVGVGRLNLNAPLGPVTGRGGMVEEIGGCFPRRYGTVDHLGPRLRDDSYSAPPGTKRVYQRPMDIDYNGPYDPYDQLFPPPPPPPRNSRVPPTAREPQGIATRASAEEEDPERQAFKEELEKVAADLERQKHEDRSHCSDEKSTALPTGNCNFIESQTGTPMSEHETGRVHGTAPAQGHVQTPALITPNDSCGEEDESCPRDRTHERLRTMEQQIAARSAVDAALKGSTGIAPPPPPPPPPFPPPPTGRARGLGTEICRYEDMDWEEKEASMILQRPVNIIQRAQRLEPAQQEAGNVADLNQLRPQSSFPSTVNRDTVSSKYHGQRPATGRPSGSRAPSVSLPMSASPQPADTQPVEAGSWKGPASSKTGNAIFGSFDEETLEKLAPSTPTVSLNEEKGNKPWRPAAGITPTLLTHGPAQAGKATQHLLVGQEPGHPPSQQLPQPPMPLPAGPKRRQTQDKSEGGSERDESCNFQGRGGKRGGLVQLTRGGLRTERAAAQDLGDESTREALVAAEHGARPSKPSKGQEVVAEDKASIEGNEKGRRGPRSDRSSGRGGSRVSSSSSDMAAAAVAAAAAAREALGTEETDPDSSRQKRGREGREQGSGEKTKEKGERDWLKGNSGRGKEHSSGRKSRGGRGGRWSNGEAPKVDSSKSSTAAVQLPNQVHYGPQAPDAPLQSEMLPVQQQQQRVSSLDPVLEPVSSALDSSNTSSKKIFDRSVGPVKSVASSPQQSRMQHCPNEPPAEARPSKPVQHGSASGIGPCLGTMPQLPADLGLDGGAKLPMAGFQRGSVDPSPVSNVNLHNFSSSFLASAPGGDSWATSSSLHDNTNSHQQQLAAAAHSCFPTSFPPSSAPRRSGFSPIPQPDVSSAALESAPLPGAATFQGFNQLTVPFMPPHFPPPPPGLGNVGGGNPFLSQGGIPPFLPTNKQPDWSTSGNTTCSGSPLSRLGNNTLQSSGAPFAFPSSAPGPSAGTSAGYSAAQVIPGFLPGNFPTFPNFAVRTPIGGPMVGAQGEMNIPPPLNLPPPSAVLGMPPFSMSSQGAQPPISPQVPFQLSGSAKATQKPFWPQQLGGPDASNLPDDILDLDKPQAATSNPLSQASIPASSRPQPPPPPPPPPPHAMHTSGTGGSGVPPQRGPNNRSAASSASLSRGRPEPGLGGRGGGWMGGGKSGQLGDPKGSRGALGRGGRGPASGATGGRGGAVGPMGSESPNMTASVVPATDTTVISALPELGGRIENGLGRNGGRGEGGQGGSRRRGGDFAHSSGRGNASRRGGGGGRGRAGPSPRRQTQGN